jgi:hypothetical protein
MRTQPFILLIMNCEKYHKKAQFQKEGWLKQLPLELIYYHVIGKDNLEVDYIFNDIDRVLYVKTLDDYISLPNKVISAYSAVYSEFNFQYIFKTDDDQHLTKPYMLQQWMNTIINNKPNYGGNLITINTHISEYYLFHSELPNNIVLQATKYCTGRFYFLSNIAVYNLIQKRSLFKSEYFEDYAVGYYLDSDIKSNFMQLNNDIFVDTILT